MVSGIRRAIFKGTPARSIATMPKPLLCRSRSAARNACSTGSSTRRRSHSSRLVGLRRLRDKDDCVLAPQRIQRSRSRFTPAAAAECGWNASLTSMSVQTSSRRVPAANAESSRLVRPEESGPQISVRHPRGRPPVRESRGEVPLEALSGAGRISRREAGVTAASFGMEEICFSKVADRCGDKGSEDTDAEHGVFPG